MPVITNQFKKGKAATVLVLTIATCLLSIWLASPSDAVLNKYQKLVNMGIIDGVVTAKEIGLDYPEKLQIQLALSSQLLEAIYEAEQEVSVMPEDIALAFEGGTRTPISIGAIPLDRGTPTEVSGANIEGFIIARGRSENFYPPTLEQMFHGAYNYVSNLARTRRLREIPLADTMERFWRSRQFTAMDLIIRNPRNNKRYIVRRVNPMSVLRDALNAVLSRRLRRARVVF